MNLRTSLRRAAIAPSLIGLAVVATTVVPSDAGSPGGGDLVLAASAPRLHPLHRPALRPLPLQLPVAHYVLTGRFGDVSGLWRTVHTGLDFAAPEGTPIHAIAPGVVTDTGYDGSYGNKTVVRLDDGTVLWFCHQSAFRARVGERVEPGQVIGLVGATGNTTGPHLHLEVHPHGGAAVDPFAWLVRQGLKP
jgi:murein DD-endopeptidase MepM/ murein hydrolase activator NlpD